MVLAGLVTGAGLIVAIGAQNAFVLRQGLARRHVTLVVTLCAGSDLVLIVAGVAGVGLLVARLPLALDVVRWVGVSFLLIYGLLAARRALDGERLNPGEGAGLSRRATVATCLAFTWLNPHVYLDTVLLLGSVANQQGPAGRWWFAVGAALASVGWFCLLGFGARGLTPVFRRRAAWRLLDGLIAVVMLALAVSLAFG